MIKSHLNSKSNLVPFNNTHFKVSIWLFDSLFKCIYSDLKFVFQVNTCLISSCLTQGFKYQGSERGLLTCFPDTDLTTAKDLMEAKGIKQLPVVKRGGGSRTGWKRRLVALLHYDSIGRCLRLVCLVSLFTLLLDSFTYLFQCSESLSVSCTRRLK